MLERGPAGAAADVVRRLRATVASGATVAREADAAGAEARPEAVVPGALPANAPVADESVDASPDPDSEVAGEDGGAPDRLAA